MKYKCSKCKKSKTSTEFYTSKGKVNSWCKECYRQDHRGKYSPSGGQTDEVRNCRQCKKEYAPKLRTESYFCSRICKDKNRKEMDKAARIASKSERLCSGCNKKIPRTARADKKWCSDECASIVRGHTSNTKRRIRTTEEIENFNRNDVYERDKWICQLCKKPVNPNLSYPNPLCASLDHVIPLSRGGSHKTTNVQLAHLHCNTSRGNKVENLSPRPPLIVNQKQVFTLSEAAILIGLSRSVLIRSIETNRVPVVQDRKFGTRYLSEKVVADLTLTGIPGSLDWKRKQPKSVVDKTRYLNCLNCGELFKVSQERKKYCSDTCLRESSNQRRRLKRKEIKCSVCAKVIKDRQLKRKVNLCSRDCVNSHRRKIKLNQSSSVQK